MDEHTACEQAYKNGYENGLKDAVKHGRWIDRYGEKYANHLYECSECKEKALFGFETDIYGMETEVQVLSDFCPNCGAKMDLEE